MKFENTFDVDAPIDEVYTALLDIEQVAPCVPGAQVLERKSEDAYEVAIKVKVGPMSMTYKGTVEILEKDHDNHRAMMRAKARETRGQGSADAHVEMTLTEEGGKTHGTIVSDVQLSGKAAAMGRGIIQDISARLVDTFSQNLATMLGGGAERPAAVATSNGDQTTRSEAVTAVQNQPAPEVAPSEAAPSAGAASSGEASSAAVSSGADPSEGVAPSGEASSAAASSEAVPSGAAPSPGASSSGESPSTPGPAPSQAAPAPPRATPAAVEAEALPIASLVGPVLLARLKDPKVAGPLLALLIAFLLLRRRR